MHAKQKGFTLIEILVVVTIIGVLAGLVVVLIPKGQHEAKKIACVTHARDLVSLIESNSATKYPDHSGPNMILWLVNKGDLQGSDAMNNLFCPGDLTENLDKAGGLEAYKTIDLKRREYGHLTSYAGRMQDDRECAAKKGGPPTVLLADDSEDHHEKGFVVGLTGGAAKWRDKVEDWDLRHDAPIEIGENSTIEELKCLIAE